MKKIKNNIYLIIIFMSSFFVISLVLYYKQVTPFGKYSLLTIDFFHQYAPMLGELFDRLKNGLNLLYSFRMGIGLPFFLNFFNYLSSPLNIFILFFQRNNLLTSFSLIIALKTSFSAVSMGFLLNKKFHNKYLFIPLAILYGFNAYFIAYYWNIMWLDGMIMLPIITYGLEKLIDNNRGIIYCISLAIMLFANYFIGYMICIFSVIYFVIYYIQKNKIIDYKCFFKKCALFIIHSLLAGGLCAFFLIPFYFSLNGISATHDTFPTSQYYNFTFLEFLFNHFSGVGSTVLKNGIGHAPNISCGVISVALLLILFCNSKIKLRIKISYIILLLVFIVSFFGYRLDFIWHAFHVPNDLPYRYSFIYSFILIIISAHSLSEIKNVDKWYIIIIYLVIMIMISLIEKVGISNISVKMVYMNYILITIYFGCYFLNKYLKNFKWIPIVILVFTLMVECFLTINNNWLIDQQYHYFYDDYEKINNAIKKINDSEMYRIEKKNLLTFNDPSWYGYYGITAFSSMEYEAVAKLQNKLGIPGNEINSFYYKKNTPIYDMMFNIKYFLDSQYNKSLNDYNLGMMYGVNEEIKDWKLKHNPFENQNNFIKKSTGISDVLEKVHKIDKKKINNDINDMVIKYKITDKGQFYLYMLDPQVNYIVIDNKCYYLSDNIKKYSSNLFNSNTEYIDYTEKYAISFEVMSKPMEIYVSYNLFENSDLLFLYKLNEKKLQEAYNLLLPNKVNINTFTENSFEGNVNVKDNMIIYTSIPYDKGWKVLVDDKDVDIFKIGDALLAFNLPSGEHIIKMTYHVPYGIISCIVSFMSIILLLILELYIKKLHCV